MAPSRTLVHQLMVAAPALLMLGIGVDARTTKSDFHFVHNSPAQNMAIDAYRPIYRSTETLLRSSKIPQATLRKLASKWILGGESGRLTLLTPCSYDDTTRDGVKGEIVRAEADVAEAESNVAFNELHSGAYFGAANNALLAAKVADVTKMSDFASLTLANLLQRRALSAIAIALPHLDQAQQAAFKSAILQFRSQKSALSAMASQARAQFLAYQARQGVAPILIQETARLTDAQDLARFTDLASPSKATRESFLASRDDVAPELLSEVRMAYNSARDTDQKIASIEATPTSKHP